MICLKLFYIFRQCANKQVLMYFLITRILAPVEWALGKLGYQHVDYKYIVVGGLPGSQYTRWFIIAMRWQAQISICPGILSDSVIWLIDRACTHIWHEWMCYYHGAEPINSFSGILTNQKICQIINRTLICVVVKEAFMLHVLLWYMLLYVVVNKALIRHVLLRYMLLYVVVNETLMLHVWMWYMLLYVMVNETLILHVLLRYMLWYVMVNEALILHELLRYMLKY